MKNSLNKKKFYSPKQEILDILNSESTKGFIEINRRQLGLHEEETDGIITNVWESFDKLINSKKIVVKCINGDFSYIRKVKRGIKVNEPIRNLRGYLKTAIVNEIRSLVKKQSRTEKSNFGLHNVEYDDDLSHSGRNNSIDLLQNIINHEDIQKLNVCIDSISNKLYRIILKLCISESDNNKLIFQKLVENHQYKSDMRAFRTAKSRAISKLKLVWEQNNDN